MHSATFAVCFIYLNKIVSGLEVTFSHNENNGLGFWHRSSNRITGSRFPSSKIFWLFIIIIIIIIIIVIIIIII